MNHEPAVQTAAGTGTPPEQQAVLSAQVAMRTVELATLSALAAELVLQQPLPTLLARALDLILPLFGVEGGSVRLRDPRQEVLHMVAQRGFTPGYVQQRQSMSLRESVIGLVVYENKPLTITSDLPRYTQPPPDQAYPYQAMLSVPLRSGEQVVGALSLASKQPRAWEQHEVDLAQAIGNQLAMAVENARLFAAQQRQISELDVIGRIGKLISGSFTFDAMLDGVYRELHNLTQASVFFLAICEPHERIITNAIFIEQGEVIPITWAGMPPKPGSMTDWITRERRSLLFQDLTNQRAQVASLGITPMPLGPANAVRSWVGVPLLADDSAVIGMIALQDYAPHKYDERTVEFLNQVASHISLGVQKVRLFADRERQLQENARLLVENARLYEESLTRVEQELEIARRIQSNLFPHQLPQLNGMALCARCIPAYETGGDFYDFVEFETSDGACQLGLVVGDASGKSIPGAMLMAIARSTVRSEARDHHTPELVMRETNNLLVHDVPQRAFVALLYATLDAAQRRLALANAGQLSPLLYRRGELTPLDPPGPRLPLGIYPDTPYAALEVALQAGDLVVCVTDGVIEAKNALGELWGFERLETLLLTQGDATPEQVVERVFAAAAVFMDGQPQHDDMTVVALRVG